jgi:hypothetical protein
MPYTLGQNGVAKLKNRSLQECARTKLKQAKLVNCFCVEAIGIVVYLQNRTPTKLLQEKHQRKCGEVKN